MTASTDPMDEDQEPLHLVTQEGQPYGSVRRCCEVCGRMCWPGMLRSAMRWTDDRVAYEAAADRCGLEI